MTRPEVDLVSQKKNLSPRSMAKAWLELTTRYEYIIGKMAFDYVQRAILDEMLE